MDYQNDQFFHNSFLDSMDLNGLLIGKETFLGGDYQREMYEAQKYDPMHSNINNIFCDSSQDSYSLMDMDDKYKHSALDIISDTKENMALISETKENIITYDNETGMEYCVNHSSGSSFANFPFNSFNPELEDLLERSVESDLDNIRYTHDNSQNTVLPFHSPSFNAENFISSDLFMKPEITEMSAVSDCNTVNFEAKEEEILPIKEDMFPIPSKHKKSNQKYINCSRIKYSKQTTHRGQGGPHMVQFTTYPAVKKNCDKSNLKVKKNSTNHNQIYQYIKQTNVQQIVPTNPTNIVLPVGSSGFQVSIPSSAPVDYDSFSSMCINDNTPSEWKEINDNLLFTNNSIYKNEKNKECNNKIEIKVYTGYDKNKIFQENHLLKLTKKMVLQPKDWDNGSSEGPSNNDANDNSFRSYPLPVQTKVNIIVSCLKSEVNILPDSILNRLSVPVSTVKRGFLKSNELVCLKKQISCLKLLEENSNHKRCLIFNCKTCLDVKEWRTELHELQKWKDIADSKSCLLSLPGHRKWSNINSNDTWFSRDVTDDKTVTTADFFATATTKSYSTEGKEIDFTNTGSRCSAVFLQNNEVVPINVSMSLNTGSIFHVNQLDIGNVSVLADNDNNAIKLYFIEKSLLYEIELQIESKEKFWQDVKVFYINIEVSFTSVCHLQSQKELEIELSVRETPILLLTKKNPQRTVISEVNLPLSTLQSSLITSIRSQLVRSPFHKLQVSESSYNRIKCCFINSCAWLDSPFVNNAERSLSETPQDWVINEFSLERKNLRTEISKCKTRKVGRPPKRTTNLKKKKPCKKKVKNSLKSIVLINIFSSDPLTNPNMENAKSDDLVWVAEQSTLKASGWSKI